MNEVAEKMEEKETQQDLDFGEDKPVQSPKSNDAPFEVEIVDDRPEEDRVAKRNETVTTKVKRMTMRPRTIAIRYRNA